MIFGWHCAIGCQFQTPVQSLGVVRQFRQGVAKTPKSIAVYQRGSEPGRFYQSAVLFESLKPTQAQDLSRSQALARSTERRPPPMEPPEIGSATFLAIANRNTQSSEAWSR